MKLSYNWLKELLPDLKLTPQEVAQTLTLHSFETVVEKEYKIDPNILVVKVTQIDPHPNADRLRLATVTDGTNTVRVVCGAPNFKVGDIVPYSPPGSSVYDEEGNKFEVKEAKIRGEVSPGMLNSPRELGFGEYHGGLWILPADTPLGKPLAELVPNDTVLNADITPNRAHDALSYIGVARDLAAILNLEIVEPIAPKVNASAEGVWSINITDTELVPRYTGASVENIHIKASPLWMQARLMMSGTRSINNVVDITNYVMYETGNPSHLFDTQKLPGKEIGVRLAEEGEKVIDLDNIEHTLSKTIPVITSDNTPVALAGVMGGLATGITEETKQGFLEVANFHPYTIQQASKELGIRTEASTRFAKSIDPNKVDTAFKRLAYLLQELAEASITQRIDFYPKPVQPWVVECNPTRISSMAGVEISLNKVQEALAKLRFQVETSKDTWKVTVPTDRLDITGEHDLVEEVIRFVGLENIPVQEIEKNKQTELPKHVQLREQLRDALVEAGMIEVYNYSFETELIANALGLINDQSLKLNNPIAPEQAYLRQSLLPRLLENLVSNKAEMRKRISKYSRSLFEVGQVFQKGEAGLVSGVLETEWLAGVSLDKSIEEVVEILKKALPDVSIEPAKGADSAIWEQGSMGIMHKGQEIGTIGSISTDSLLKIHDKVHLPVGIKSFVISLSQLG